MAGREDYFADLQQIVDRIMMHPDPVHRVTATHQLLRDARKILIDARGESIYRLLQTTNGIEAQRLTGLDRASMSVWCSRWRTKRGMPKIGRKRKDFTNGMDLSGGSSQSTP